MFKGWFEKKASKNKFSLENLRYLYGELVKNQIVTEKNKVRVVEILRQIAELMIWGDQHNENFFDFFCEKSILSFFLKILSQKCDKKVKIQVIQTLSILIQNISSETSVFYLLSNNYINDLIVHRFDFSDEEVIAYYISFLKVLSLKLNERTIQFFFNETANDFPLYTEAVKFFKHPETMVRIAVRTLSLNVYRCNYPPLRRFILDRSAVPYFSNLVWFLRDEVLTLNHRVKETQYKDRAQLEEMLESLIDLLYYLQDILSLDIEALSAALIDQLLSHFILPVLVGSLYDNERDDKLVTRRLALFLLAQLWLVFSDYAFINSIAVCLIDPSPPRLVEKLVTSPPQYPVKAPVPLSHVLFPKSTPSGAPPSPSVFDKQKQQAAAADDMEEKKAKRDDLPQDQNLRARSAVPDIGPVSSPIRAADDFKAIAEHNDYRDSLLHLLVGPSADERLVFGAASVLLALIKNSKTDADMLSKADMCPQHYSRSLQLLSALTQSLPDVDEDDEESSSPAKTPNGLRGRMERKNSASYIDTALVLAGAGAGTGADKEKERRFSSPGAVPSSAAAAATPAAAPEDSAAAAAAAANVGTSDQEATLDSEAAKALALVAAGGDPEKEKLALRRPSRTPSAEQVAEESASTWGIAHSPDEDGQMRPRSITDPLAGVHSKHIAVLDTQKGKKQKKSAAVPDSNSSVTRTDRQRAQTVIGAKFAEKFSHKLAYSEHLVGALLKCLAQQPPYRLATVQLLIDLLCELVYDKTPGPCINAQHIEQLEDIVLSSGQRLVNRFRDDASSHLCVDVIEDEWKSMLRTPSVRDMITNAMSLLPICADPKAGIPMAYRKPNGSEENLRLSVQLYLVMRQLRFKLLKEADEKFPFTENEVGIRRKQEISLAERELLPCVKAADGPNKVQPNTPKLALVKDTHLFLVVQPHPKVGTKGQVELVTPLRHIEIMLDRGNPCVLYVTISSRLRPHEACILLPAKPDRARPIWSFTLGFPTPENCAEALALLEEGRKVQRAAILKQILSILPERTEETPEPVPIVPDRKSQEKLLSQRKGGSGDVAVDGKQETEQPGQADEDQVVVSRVASAVVSGSAVTEDAEEVSESIAVSTDVDTVVQSATVLTGVASTQ